MRSSLCLMALLAGLLLGGCAAGVRDHERPYDPALPAAESGAIASAALPALAANPGLTGVALSDSNADAFIWRAISARVAASSLDLQYYIWHDDLTGRLLAGELLRAADRGVRVRMLIDDVDVRARDAVLRTLDAHPAIEVRVFNPFASASGWFTTATEVLWRGARLNRRMHNKAWIADGRVAMVGGRNIGDEYFGAASDVNFSDLGLMLVGPAVAQVNTTFDRYWNHPAAVRIATLERGTALDGGLDALRAALEANAKAAQGAPYVRDVLASIATMKVSLILEDLVWTADVTVLSDAPDKVDANDRSQSELYDAIGVLINGADTRLRILSPYFVPGHDGTAAFAARVAAGARVEIVTNSLAANDVAVVHGGYAADRVPLLRAGIALFELRPTSHAEGTRAPSFGSSGASLHAKALTIDGERVFVGSFNLDPRSAWLNSEMGVVVGSPELAGRLDAVIDLHQAPTSSWRVDLEGAGRLRWTGTVDGKEAELRHEPDASLGRRFQAFLARILPLRSQL